MVLLSVEDSDPLGDGGNDAADPTTVERGEKGSLLILNEPGDDGSPAIIIFWDRWHNGQDTRLWLKQYASLKGLSFPSICKLYLYFD